MAMARDATRLSMCCSAGMVIAPQLGCCNLSLLCVYVHMHRLPTTTRPRSASCDQTADALPDRPAHKSAASMRRPRMCLDHP
ncbi:hypothetical protein BC831DRAFT_482311, partial [Entophlyctis helioformis]